VQKQKATTLI